MIGLDKKLSEGRRMPKKAVMEAVGATPNTTYKEFAAMLRDAMGPKAFEGRKITEPLPLTQVKPAVAKALKLRRSTPYTGIVQKAWAP